MLLIGAYAGYRALETRRPRRDEHPQRRALPRAPQSQGADLDDEAAGLDGAIERADHRRRLGASAAASGLGLIKFVPFAAPASLALTIYATLPILRRAELAIRQRKVNNDVLCSIISVATLGLTRLLAAGIQASAYHLGQLMALRAKDSTTRGLRAVIAEPEQVWIRHGDAEVSMPLARVRRDDVVVVRAGEVIPVDGVVVKGPASVDERALRGEAIPAEKHEGDVVYAATLVVGGVLEIRVQRSGAATTAARVAALLERSTHFRSQIQLKGERWSDAAAAPVIALSALSAPFIGASAAVAMLFAVPTNTIRAVGSLQTASYFTACYRRGVLIQDGRGLERLHSVDCVLFDKTGTLTEGALTFVAAHTRGLATSERLLALAAALDRRVAHPIAEAIVREAARRQLELPPVESVSVIPGGGVIGRIQGQQICLGSTRFMARQGIAAPVADPRGIAGVHVAIDGELQGWIELEPQVRAEAREVVNALRSLGVRHLAVVSGDAEGPTAAVARALGLDAWHAALLPEDKTRLVED
ncbi:MAG: HAD-IC family P-type ATPase, partial [Myxococcales bacterium]|nr:HAD-IC family P-type ATPase [Myxococcales bacterium]